MCCRPSNRGRATINTNFGRRTLVAAVPLLWPAAALAQSDPVPSWNDGALDEATTRGWTVVDMKNDWKVVFPVQKE